MHGRSATESRGPAGEGKSGDLDHLNFPLSSLRDAEKSFRERAELARGGTEGKACRLTGYEKGQFRDGPVGAEGYGACLGHDLERSLAIAILDTSLMVGQHVEEITVFVAAQAQLQREAQDTLLRNVEGTRAEMETF